MGYNYDVMDNLVSVSDSDSSLTMAYDALKRLTSVTTGGPIQPEVTLTYSYDTNGNRVSMNTPTGTTAYAYDALNRLLSMTDPSAKTYTFSYDALGRRIGLGYPNGVTTTYTYDNSNRLMELVTRDPQLATLSSYNYNYDKVGNRTSLTELAGTHDYAYDSLYQLIQATHPSIPTEQFSYDPVGNRLGDAVGNSYSYNNANQLLDYDGVSFEYDANGNMISKTDASGTTLYAFDSENRLTRIDLPDGGFAEYKYAPFGKRIEKNVNGTITRYVYDNEDIIAEYDENGNMITEYIHGPGVDEPIAMKRDGQTYYYHTDALGSVIAITDEYENVVQRYEYDSFGNIVFTQDPTFTQPYTYTGREYDPESGLYYYRARYYDAKVGRFISEDPIGFDGGINLYSYVGNSPVNYTDPEGLGPLDCIRCGYYYWQCAKKGLKCKEEKCQENEDITSDELWRECVQKIPECQKMLEYCGKCGLWPWTPKPRLPYPN